MANITGKLVFDQNRNGQEDVGTDVGLAKDWFIRRERN